MTAKITFLGLSPRKDDEKTSFIVLHFLFCWPTQAEVNADIPFLNLWLENQGIPLAPKPMKATNENRALVDAQVICNVRHRAERALRDAGIQAPFGPHFESAKYGNDIWGRLCIPVPKARFGDAYSLVQKAVEGEPKPRLVRQSPSFPKRVAKLARKVLRGAIP